MDVPLHLLVVLPLSIAAGLDLYLTLLAAGTGMILFGGDPVPELSTWVSLPLTLGLVALYLAELMAELRPVSALFWHNLQLLFRPLGAALLAFHLLRGEAAVFMVMGAAMAGTVAAFCHVLFWGLLLVAHLTTRPRRALLALTLLADVAAIAFVVLASFRVEPGVAAAGLLLLCGLAFGHHLHGATRFGLALLADRVWGIVSPTGWKPGSDLPSWVGELSRESVQESARGARAGTVGVPGIGRFRAGWILQGNQYLLFGFRAGWGTKAERLEGEWLEEETGPLAKTVRFRSPEGARWALFLQMGLNAPEPHKW